MKRTYQICVSGAAAGPSVGPAVVSAGKVAREIAGKGHILLTGATRGLPYAAATAAKKAGGTSIGLSPAASRREHVKSYRLPVDAFDTIVYTGFGYTGRNLLLIRSADAVVMVGGRIGTLNELTIALEEHKPVGVLLGSHGMTDEVEHVLKAARRARVGVIFDEDPSRLVDELIAMVNHKNRKLYHESES